MVYIRVPFNTGFTVLLIYSDKCKLTPKKVAAELPPLLCELTLIFLLNQLEASTSQEVNVKHFCPLLV